MPSRAFTAILVSLIFISFGLNMALLSHSNEFVIPNQIKPIIHVRNDSALYRVPVDVINHQKVATASPYNQKISVDSLTFEVYEAGKLQNVRWTTSNGTVIPSWIESGDNNTSINTVYWLKMPFRIEAQSNVTIYLNFMKQSINLFSTTGNEGVSPQLTSVYGEYDNGNVVFPGYWNFSGRSLPSGWQEITSGNGTYSVQNGVTLGESKLVTDMRLVTTSTYSGIVDALVTSQNYASFRGTGIELATVLPTPSGFQTGYRFFESNNHPAGTTGGFIDSYSSGTGQNVVHTPGDAPGAPYVMTVEWPHTGLEIWKNNYTYYLSCPSSTITQQSQYISLYAGADHSNYGLISFSWVRVRSYLPNSVMPSVSLPSTISKV